jgi:hypothetical protein
MCLSELLATLRGQGIAVTEPQIRWAIKTGKIRRPPLDRSLRYRFEESDVQGLARLFGSITHEQPGLAQKQTQDGLEAKEAAQHN